ncbi:MAG: hypothetical protein GWP08_08260 [Nitrospiraceae bacterium]|nr:hypothetical protein [Nitrospiraceae bacterium]
MRIALAGSGRLAASIMAAVLDSPHELVALVQNGRTRRGFGRALASATSHVFGARTTVLGLAARHRVPLIWIDRMDQEELAPLRELKPDLLVVGGFSVILNKPLLKLARIGSVNVHSSLLPKHRGPNPFLAVVLHGEKETGVTFHIMEEGIDTGDIIEQYAFPLTDKDTSYSVYQRACNLARERVVEVLDGIEAHGLHGAPQDHKAATYDQRLAGDDTYIDWTRPASEIDRFVRACRPFVMPRFRSRGRNVYVTRIAWDDTPVDAAPGTVIESRPYVKIATGRGTVSILVAYVSSPPWVWPSLWLRPKPAGKVE